MAERAKWVEHTQFVLGESQSVMGTAVDMETGLRGYLLAGQEQFLEPYSQGQSTPIKPFRNYSKRLATTLAGGTAPASREHSSGLAEQCG